MYSDGAILKTRTKVLFSHVTLLRACRQLVRAIWLYMMIQKVRQYTNLSIKS